MAPELLLEGQLNPTESQHAKQRPRNQPRYNPKAVDVWALGVMLFLLVTGVYPFEVSSLLLKTLGIWTVSVIRTFTALAGHTCIACLTQACSAPSALQGLKGTDALHVMLLLHFFSCSLGQKLSPNNIVAICPNVRMNLL